MCIFVGVTVCNSLCAEAHHHQNKNILSLLPPPFFFGLFCPLFSHVAGRIPELGIKLAPTVVEEAWSPNHWTTREFPNMAPF